MISTGRRIFQTVNHYYHKSTEVAKNEGFSVLVKKGFYRLKTLAYATNEAIWFCRLLEETLPEIDVPDVRILLAAELKFENWLQQHQAAFPWIYVEQEVLATRNDPKFAFIAKNNNKIVGYLKVAVKNAYVLDYDTHLRLPNDVAFIQDTFVLPKFRCKSIARCIISRAMTYLKNHGYFKIFCHIPKWNEASIRTYTGLGFKACGRIRFVRIFKYNIYTTKPERLIRTAPCK